MKGYGVMRVSAFIAPNDDQTQGEALIFYFVGKFQNNGISLAEIEIPYKCNRMELIPRKGRLPFAHKSRLQGGMLAYSGFGGNIKKFTGDIQRGL